MRKKYNIITISFILLLIFACKRATENIEQAPSPEVDRYIAMVKLDTVKKYIELNNLGEKWIFITNNDSKCKVSAKYRDKDRFYRLILGQPFEGKISISTLAKESKYYNKWKILDDTEMIGFECDLEKKEGINYIYLPYEILININRNRKL